MQRSPEEVLRDAVMTAIENAVLHGLSPERINEVLSELAGHLPYPVVSKQIGRRAKEWQKGRDDRLAGQPCRSANGAYLEGWYSVE